MTIRLGPERIISDDALQPFLFRASSGDMVVCGFARLAREKWRRNRFPATPRWFTSHDGGERWQPVARAAGEQPLGMLASGIERPDGRFLLIETYAWRDEGGDGPFTGQLWEARDGFRRIAGPLDITVRVPEAIASHDDCGEPVDIVCFHRSVLDAPGGALLATGYARFAGDDTPSDYMPQMRKWRCILLRSEDDGMSWDYVSTIAVDPSVGQEGFDEPTLIRLTACGRSVAQPPRLGISQARAPVPHAYRISSPALCGRQPDSGFCHRLPSRGPHAGRFLCHMRTGSAGCPIYETTSDDEGRSWSAPRPLEAVGVDPCLIEMTDGTVALSYGTRLWDSGGRSISGRALTPTNKVAFSGDGGGTWGETVEIPLQSPCTGIGTTTNYTELVELAPGRLLLAYDIGMFGDERRYLAARTIEM